MTNCCSCLEIQTLRRWGILFESNSTVHHCFCSPPQTVPWLLFPGAVHWHGCLVGWCFLHSNQASVIVTFLPLALNSLGSWHTVAMPLVEQKSKGEKEKQNKKLFKFVSVQFCHSVIEETPLTSFFSFFPGSSLMNTSSESQRANRLFPVLLPACPTFYQGHSHQLACFEWLKMYILITFSMC